MTTSSVLRSLLLLVIGAGAGALVATRLAHSGAPMPAAAQTTTLEADVAHLKDIVPGQSHAMIDVGYHMANLWFAVERKNWAFAAFEFDETRNRIRWTIRINPVRKDPERPDPQGHRLHGGRRGAVAARPRAALPVAPLPPKGPPPRADVTWLDDPRADSEA